VISINSNMQDLDIKIRGKTFYIFLENKIISLDSIIPFALEINNKCGVRFVFVVFDKVTYDAIVEDNITLYDAIKSIGNVEYILGFKKQSKFFKRLSLIFRMARISYQVSYKDGYVLDFGGLNVKPLVFIRWLFPSKRRILCESSSSGRVIPDDIVKKGDIVTNTLSNIYHYRTNDMDCFKEKDKYFPLNAAILLGFHKSWNYFKHKDAYKTKQILFSDSRNAPAWVGFISQNFDSYINHELNILNSSSKYIISIVIGRLKYAEVSKLHRNAFRETLISLAECSKDFPVFIKPKVYDDMGKLKKLINEVNEEFGLNYILTKLHPLVLARRSIMSVFVSKTRVINDFYISGVPIVQNLIGFSGDYLDRNTSPLADHVVTGSNKNFEKVVQEIIDNKNNVPNTLKKIESNLDCDVFL